MAASHKRNTAILNLLTTALGNGIEGRKIENQRNIVRFLSKSSDPVTIPEIAKHIDVSIPIATKLTKEFVHEGLVSVDGKKVSDNGRRPNTYSLDRSKFYVVGVEILSRFIHVSVVGTDFEVIAEFSDRSFELDRTQSCLDRITRAIKKTIKASKIKPKHIIGVGVGITDAHHGLDGGDNMYFSEGNLKLEEHLKVELKLPVLLDSDTRTISIAEQSLGLANGVDNVLVVKVSRKLGMAIIVDRHVVRAKNGLSTNFDHMKFGVKQRPCSCGKIGCIGTEVGGDALLVDLKEAIANNARSYFFNDQGLEDYAYHDVLDHVLKGDELAIDLIQKQGELLGRAIGNVINLLTPEMVILGGEFIMVKDFFIESVNIGIKKTALIGALGACEIVPSTLGRYLGSKAGACMVLKEADMIAY